MTEAFLAGFALGGSLIVAIGAQNAFVIRQGAQRQHVFAVALFCALADALLVWSGVLGLGALLDRWPGLITVMTWGGIVFLITYGVLALRRAMAPRGMDDRIRDAASLGTALLACAGFTFLNPHVYLDTVILVGSLANARPEPDVLPFASGATTASFVWFFGLAYGAAALAPWLSRPTVWRLIDLSIALVMFLLAARLAFGPAS
jgi:L-lysine exporter family protein LysE/ArgO